MHKRIQILFCQTLSAKTAPQPNFVSDVLRAAPLFRRENTGRLRKLAKNSTLLEVWQWNILDPSQQPHFPAYCPLIPALVPMPAYPCAIVQRCASLCTNFSGRRRSSSCSWQVWMLFITSPSFPSRSTHTSTEWYSCTLNYCYWNQILPYTTLTVLCFIAKCYK